ncbi:MAG: orotate phosphoribosyltransferase [Nanoarchaeota archaeon]
MDQRKSCMNCASELGKYSCSKCGKLVGELCFDFDKILCVVCAGGLVI